MAFFRVSNQGQSSMYTTYEQTGYASPIQTNWDVTFTTTPKVGDLIFYMVSRNSGKPTFTVNSNYADEIFQIDMSDSSNYDDPLICFRVKNVPTSNPQKISSYLIRGSVVGWSGVATAVLLFY